MTEENPRADLTLWREDPPKADETKLPMPELRERARRINGIDGLDATGLGLMALFFGVAAYLQGRGVLDNQILSLLGAAVPSALTFGLVTLIRKLLVYPRIGKQKPVSAPFLPFGLCGLILSVALAVSIGREVGLEIQNYFIIAFLPQMITDALFLWKPRLFIYPLVMVTLLWLNIGAAELLLIMGFLYVASGVGVFTRFLLDTAGQTYKDTVTP